MFDIYPLNPIWWALIAFAVFVCVLLWYLLKGKNESTKRKVLLVISASNIVLFFVYKFALVNYYADEGYTAIEYLPLQLCNINILLIPIALIIKKRSLCAFVFYIAPIAALLPLLMPESGFIGESIFLFKNIGYYFTHTILIITGVSFITLDMVKVRYRDVANCFIILIALAGIMLIVNMIFKATFYPESNFFFTNGPWGSGGEVAPLVPLWKLISVPILYMVPVLVAIIPYELLLTAIARKAKGTAKGMHAQLSEKME
jgi:uncharacterized membrane protein YwaF